MKRDNTIILNYTGYKVLIKNFTKTTGESKSKELLPLGTVYINEKDVMMEGNRFGAFVISVKGLPPPMPNTKYIVTKKVAEMLCGKRQDLLVPINMTYESSKNIIIPDEVKMVCDALGEVTVDYY